MELGMEWLFSHPEETHEDDELARAFTLPLWNSEFGTKGKFEGDETYSFNQDDLLAEGVLILDTYAEIFVGVGQTADPKEEQNAFEIGQRYIEIHCATGGLHCRESSQAFHLCFPYSWEVLCQVALECPNILIRGILMLQ